MTKKEELKLMEGQLEYAVKWNDTPNIKKWLYYIERIDEVEEEDD
uniref:Uncharacterized protein n=1 Tax=viral metagenome TaxID=1070528 RepID=A0A6H1ZDE4_9ZZZZ